MLTSHIELANVESNLGQLSSTALDRLSSVLTLQECPREELVPFENLGLVRDTTLSEVEAMIEEVENDQVMRMHRQL